MIEISKHDEDLVKLLSDNTTRREYARPYNGYKTGIAARVLGGFLVFCGNFIYGVEPSYLKFRAVEIIARIPYHSWESAAYTLLTLHYANETKAMKLSRISHFSRLSQDNETMHVVVISKLSQKEEISSVFLFTLIPVLFSFFYFWAAYWLYLISRKSALELNYLFEQHAYDQYSEFLKKNEKSLKKKNVGSEYLAWYGRHPMNQYEFFESVRNDELIHRNRSIHEIELHCR